MTLLQQAGQVRSIVTRKRCQPLGRMEPTTSHGGRPHHSQFQRAPGTAEGVQACFAHPHPFKTLPRPLCPTRRVNTPTMTQDHERDDAGPNASREQAQLKHGSHLLDAGHMHPPP